MTRKDSLGLPAPIKDPSMITYLPELRTDELALHTRTRFRMLVGYIGFAYMYLSYTASESDICQHSSRACHMPVAARLIHPFTA